MGRVLGDGAPDSIPPKLGHPYLLWPTLQRYALLLKFLASFAAFAAGSAHAVDSSFNEPRLIGELLARAQQGETADRQREAARFYCEAAKLGSLEAQFQLGRRYAMGQGVVRDNAIAATLLSGAAQQGHLAAAQMIAGLPLGEMRLPGCMTGDPESEGVQAAGEPMIMRVIARLPPAKRKIAQTIERLAPDYGVDPLFALSVAAVESNFEVGARSDKAAQGVMQLIPETADRFNVRDAFQVEQNVRGGLAYLRWLLAYFEGDVALVAAAYNAGEGAVDRHRGVPPYAETRAYVKQILGLYAHSAHPFEARIVLPSSTLVRR